MFLWPLEPVCGSIHKCDGRDGAAGHGDADRAFLHQNQNILLCWSVLFGRGYSRSIYSHINKGILPSALRICAKGRVAGNQVKSGTGSITLGSAEAKNPPGCKYPALFLAKQTQIPSSLIGTSTEQHDLLSPSPGWDVPIWMHKSMPKKAFGGLFNAFCNEDNRDHFF